MPKINTTVHIEKLEAKVKLVEEKMEGEVVDRHLMTEVKVEYEGTPAQLDKVLYALKSGHQVDVTFATPQLGLDEALEEKEAKDPALVGAG